MLYSFNNHIRRLRQADLVGFYLVMTILYVVLPEPMAAFKPLLSSFLAALLGLIVYRACIGSGPE